MAQLAYIIWDNTNKTMLGGPFVQSDAGASTAADNAMRRIKTKTNGLGLQDIIVTKETVTVAG